jgi:hypothetical protein
LATGAKPKISRAEIRTAKRRRIGCGSGGALRGVLPRQDGDLLPRQKLDLLPGQDVFAEITGVPQ